MVFVDPGWMKVRIVRLKARMASARLEGVVWYGPGSESILRSQEGWQRDATGVGVAKKSEKNEGEKQNERQQKGRGGWRKKRTCNSPPTTTTT